MQDFLGVVFLMALFGLGLILAVVVRLDASMRASDS